MPSKLFAAESLPEAPIRRGYVVGSDGLAVACSHLKRQVLPIKQGIALPILAPISRHRLPPCARSLHGDRVHIADASHIGNEHQVEVRVAIDGEVDAAFLRTRHSPVMDRDDAAPVDTNVFEGSLRHVEMLKRRIAPTARIVGESVVWRAEIGGGDDHGGSDQAPLGLDVCIPTNFKTSTAAETTVEERRAKGGGVRAITGGVEITVTASTPHRSRGIASAVKSGVGATPAFCAEPYK